MKIIPAEPHHEAQIIDLGRRTLGWDEDPRFTDLYRWKHDQNPIADSSRWVAIEDGIVVGIRVYLRWQFERRGVVTDAVRAVDTATDPRYQGRGIFKALTLGALDQLRDDGVAFVFNTPNDNSRPGNLKMGWIELGNPPVAITPRLRSLPRVARSRTAAEHWSEPSQVGHDAPIWFAEPLHSQIIETPGSDDDLWRTRRTPAWLQWRYGLEHLAYRVLTTGDLAHGDRLEPGAAVFRLRRRGSSLEATVADVFTKSDRSRRKLLRGILRATGADYLLSSGGNELGLPPSISLPAFSPLVTWRSLHDQDRASVDDFAFTLGDLELF